MGDHEFQHGLELFNTGKFFDAHEVWEDVWRAAPALAVAAVALQGELRLTIALVAHRSAQTAAGPHLHLALP